MTTEQQEKPPLKRAKTALFIDAYNLIYRAYHSSLVDIKEEAEVRYLLETPESIAETHSNNYPHRVERIDGQVFEYRKEMVKSRACSVFNKEGLPLNAIDRVAVMLKKIRKEYPDVGFCLAVFDGGGNFRKELDEKYKANRKEMPEELKLQMPYIEELFKLMGFPIYRPTGVEADDLIGTLAKRAGDNGFQVNIISQDKDFRQIASDNVKIIDTMNDIIYDRNKVIEVMGIAPENVVDYLALMGDNADNVSGVNKCGPKTAVKWLTEYGTLENIIVNAEKITGVVGKNLKEAIDSGNLLLCKKLVTMDLNVDIKFKNSDLTLLDVDKVAFNNFCENLGITRLKYRLNIDNAMSEDNGFKPDAKPQQPIKNKNESQPMQSKETPQEMPRELELESSETKENATPLVRPGFGRFSRKN